MPVIPSDIGHYARPDVVSLMMNREKQAVLVSRGVAVDKGDADEGEQPAERDADRSESQPDHGQALDDARSQPGGEPLPGVFQHPAKVCSTANHRVAVRAMVRTRTWAARSVPGAYDL